ncbi:hypothetical protein LX36DRAFT_324386 [Colletotrichum falcatum]|nr:hypothetical protein LX36DRAFT_324386 [Colletotrichum falcatum]
MAQKKKERKKNVAFADVRLMGCRLPHSYVSRRLNIMSSHHDIPRKLSQAPSKRHLQVLVDPSDHCNLLMPLLYWSFLPILFIYLFSYFLLLHISHILPD